jgi:outer membrane protein assembly factor BamB
MKRRVRRTWLGLIGFLAVGLATGVGMTAGKPIAHAYRWMVTVASGAGAVSPPWALLWDRNPIWFERWNPGGFSESPSRRLAAGPEEFVTVMRRTLYGLDKHTGQSVWSLPLQGEEIFDWAVADGVLVYAAYGHDEKDRRYWGIRAAVDLRTRKEVWARTRPTPYLRKEWLLIQGERGIFGDNRTEELTALTLRDGATLWTAPQNVDPVYPVEASWFVYGNVLCALAGHKGRGGLFLKRFDLATGRELPALHLVGDQAVSNLYAPSVITPDGRLFVEYHAFRVRKAWIVAYDLEAARLLWERQTLDGTEPGRWEVRRAKRIVLGGAPTVAVVTSAPARYLLLDPATGTVLRDQSLPATYAGWTEHNALLYSHPYLFTSARRPLQSGMAYDLICLNLETGTVEWTHEISRQDDRFLTASAEVLNFLLETRQVYLSRTDAHVMAFRAAPARTP